MRLIRITQPEGNYVEYTYDARGSATQTRSVSKTPGTPPDIVTSAAYAASCANALTCNKPMTTTDARGNVTDYTYDSTHGGVLTVTRPAPTTGAVRPQTYLTQAGPQGTATSAYDLADRRTQLTYPGTGLYVNYDYLVTGETTKIRENGAISGVGVLATYAYDDLGRRTSLTFGNGAVQSFTYDPVSRLASLTNNLSGTTNDLSTTFAYNPASQIASATRTGDAYAWTGPSSEDRDYTANGLNQYTTVDSASFNYDAKGNLTSDGTSSFTYSSENLLLTGPNSSALAYDPLMRLRQIASGSSTDRLVYDGLDRIAEYDGSNALQRRYVFGPGIDEPIVWYEGSGTTDRRFLSADERGSIVSVTNSAGALLGINKYDEYGRPQSGNSGGNIGVWGYTGQAWLPSLNVWYYKARELDPELGRFLQTDPIGIEGGVNLYAYVLNDPVNFTDPLGLAPKLCGAGPDPDKIKMGPCPSLTPLVIIIGSLPTITERVEAGGGSGGTRDTSEGQPGGPHYSTCTSALAGPLYNAAGQVTNVAAGVVGVGAVVAVLGGGNPATDAVGGAIAAFGGVGVALGTFAQINAGAYYALHGNWRPLQNVAINQILGLAKTPKVANPSLDRVSESTLDTALGPDTHQCKP